MADKKEEVKVPHVPVPETVKKLSNTRAKLEEQLSKQKADSRKNNRQTRRSIYLRARQYEHEYKKTIDNSLEIRELLKKITFSMLNLKLN